MTRPTKPHQRIGLRSFLIFINIILLAGAAIGQEFDQKMFSDLAVADDRAFSGRPRKCGLGRSRPAEHVLLRIGRRRIMEIRKLRPDMDTHLR